MTETEVEIREVKHLTNLLDEIFGYKLPWEITKQAILKILPRVNFSTSELNTYTYWDYEKAYTRNLAYTDHKHYTLLILCWNGGKESKIHDHPVDGCFVKTLRGCLKETRYRSIDEKITKTGVSFMNEGQIAWIDDSIGLHKVTSTSTST